MYDSQARQTLKDKLGYELKLLDFLYDEADLGHEDGGTIVLGDNGNRVEVTISESLSQGRVNQIMERLDALVFVTSYKLLDMQFEWILEEHEKDGIVSGVPNRLSRKIGQWNDLEAHGNLQSPLTYTQHADIRNRVFSLYEDLRDHRNAVIHRDDFEIMNENFQVTNSTGTTYQFSREQLFGLARTGTLSSQALISGTLSAEEERLLKTYLDMVDFVHGEGLYDIAPPWAETVEITVNDEDGTGWIIDIDRIWNEFESTTPEATGFFLHIIGRHEDEEGAEWRIPSEELDRSGELDLSRDTNDWESYRIDS